MLLFKTYVDVMTIDKMSVGEMTIDKMKCRSKFQSSSCLKIKKSVDDMLLVKMYVGKMTIDKMSVGENDYRQNEMPLKISKQQFLKN